jgi:hypothetical protein
MLSLSAPAADLDRDVADPMYIEKLGDFVSKTSMDFGRYFQFREIAEYGFSNRFSVAADVKWQSGTRDDNRFSNVGLMGTFRAGAGETGATDILAGFGYGGFGIVPNYTSAVYTVGLRTGRQWPGATLAATVLTNWYFNQDSGVAYIDLTPEAYFRLSGDWSAGLGATLRKSTTSVFDQEWINTKIGCTIGYTGYFVNAGYEFESQDFRIGGNINMLF